MTRGPGTSRVNDLRRDLAWDTGVSSRSRDGWRASLAGSALREMSWLHAKRQNKSAFRSSRDGSLCPFGSGRDEVGRVSPGHLLGNPSHARPPPPGASGDPREGPAQGGSHTRSRGLAGLLFLGAQSSCPHGHVAGEAADREAWEMGLSRSPAWSCVGSPPRMGGRRGEKPHRPAWTSAPPLGSGTRSGAPSCLDFSHLQHGESRSPRVGREFVERVLIQYLLCPGPCGCTCHKVSPQ